MKKLIMTTLFAILFYNIKAQTVFISNAKVTFEKKVNLQRQFEGNTWVTDESRNKIPKYYSTFWDLNFNESKSSYKALKKEPEANADQTFMFYRDENEAEMFTNLEKKQRIFTRSLNHESYLLKDTIPHVDWKILHDVRKIAGFDCRKAIGVINDSVYVVAFYTEEILFKGGPEGFTGLPGMILGIAIPRFNTTWFATKIEAINTPIYAIEEPTKGKRADTEKDFNKMISSLMNNNIKKDPKIIEEIRKNIYGFIL